MAETFKYRAFLSYSHADTRAAKRVHARLEGFHIDKELVGRETPTGPIPGALRPIFRDRYEFDAGGSLVEQTIAALDGSAALIVLASPHAARSKYVNEELRQFKSRHPERPVIPLIVDGEPGDPEKECFPPTLRFSVASDGAITDTPVDVIAADLREKGDGIELALAKVVARLLGLAPDDVYGRADRERRRQARRTRRMWVLVGVLLVGIVTVAGLAYGGWLNEGRVRVRAAILVDVFWPKVLTVEAERTLKTKQTFSECTYCPEMVVVPAGEFMMGSAESEKGRNDDEGPQHRVTIAKPFAVSRFEVTFDEWDACAAVDACAIQPGDQGWGRGRQPLINVSWDDAQQYLAWLSHRTGKSYRLLSEAEWEYAARAGSDTAYSWGDEIGIGKANCNGCGSRWDNKQTAPVGSFAPNAFGLYEMHGNALEWVEDCYQWMYRGAPTNGSARTDGDCRNRVLRGGAWGFVPSTLSSASRYSNSPGFRNYFVGFRVARTLTP